MINPFSVNLSLPLVSKFMKLEARIFALEQKKRIIHLENELLLILAEEDAIDTHKKSSQDQLKEVLLSKIISPRFNALIENHNALMYILSAKKPDFKWTLFHLKKIYHFIKSSHSLEEASQTWRLTPEIKADFSSGDFMNVEFEYAPPEEIQNLMEEFSLWVDQKEDHLNPLLKIGIILPLFALIAPFPSHNSRMLRFLTLDLLGFYGYELFQKSMLIAQFNTKNSQDCFFQSLKKLSAGETDLSAWLGSWVSTLDLTLKVEEEKRMESKTISFAHVRLESPISSKIQECLKGGKKLSISEISKSTGINRNTLKNYLRNHVKAGILVQKGEKKASWYELGGNKI